MEIEQALNADHTDEEKAVGYLSALKMYSHYDNVDITRMETKQQPNIASEVLQSVPLGHQYMAKWVFDHLARNKDVQIGEKWKLIYKQQKITRITDYQSNQWCFQKKSQTDHPTGWKEFADSLKVVNIPRELVLNEDGVNYTYPQVETKRLRSQPSDKENQPKVLCGRKSFVWRKTPIKSLGKSWVEF